MIRFKNIFLARAAMTLLVAVLSSATAWAQSLTGSGTAADPYIINSDAAYEAFATKPAYWASGVYVRLTADVSTTKMVGTSSYKFQGYFFGNGHTLTVNLSSSAEFCAPFCYAEGATIIGLHTAGTVTTNSFKYGSGLIGEAATNVTIRNCWSSVTIVSDVSGDGTHGGFIGVSGANVVIKNSLFDGVICCTSENRTNSCGGFVGWRNIALTIENCLFAPAAIPEGKYAIGSFGTSTFARNDNPTLTNSYYKTALGTTQGTAVGSKNATELASALGSGWQVSGENVVPVMVSNNLADAIISGVEPYYLYTGSEIPVTYTVTDINGNLLTLGTDYTATFSPATVQASGDYTLTLTGTSNYTGTRVINFTVGDGIPVTSATTTFKDGLTYKVTSNVTVSSRITVSGTVKLLLGEGATLTASKGIELSNGNQLTIDGTGTLTSNGNAESKSGIGAYDAGTLIINGGVINAEGGPYAAGIGGDEHNGNGGRIIINGGVVNATGGSYGAGIGGGKDSWAGSYGQCGIITINGGQVTATGGSSAPGIGPGCYADDYSGTVTLGWTNTTDFIYASSYNGISTLTFADGKHFVLDGTNVTATTTNIGGKKIFGCILLVDYATDNSTKLKNEDIVTVKLDDRTLKKNGEWNTLCLPFDVVLANSPLAGATAKTLTTASVNGNTVTLNFSEAVTTLQAGVPYIIKWADGSDIENPVFTGVTIDKTDHSITAANGQVQFIGYYDAFDINATNTDIYYMTAGNTLRHTGVPRTLKACRAYFKFGEPASARNIVLNFGDEETTGVVELKNGRIEELKSDGAWYSIDGVKLDKKPTRKGLYIFNGKKIVIK
jgi:hypothetical protein